MSEVQGWVFVSGILGLFAIGIGAAIYALYRSQIAYEQALKRINEASHD